MLTIIRKGLIRVACYCFLLFFTYSQVLAASAGNIAAQIPSLFDPGITQKNIKSTLPSNPPSKGKPIKTAGTQQPITPIAGADTIYFRFKKVIITGNTAFSTKTLEQIFESDVNKTISYLTW